MKTKTSKALLLFVLLVSGATLQFANAQTYSGGVGTIVDPYQIANKADLKYLSENSGEWSKHFIQTADINFTLTDFQVGGDFHNSGTGFISIGGGTPFGGSYNGSGYTIDGLFINASSSMNGVGMFGYSFGGTIRNVHLTNIEITNSSSSGDTGGLIGFMNSSSLVKNCSVSGNVTGYGTTGGLVGYCFGSTIVNCNSNCVITSNGGMGEAGGLAGFVSTGSVVDKSYSTGSVIGRDGGTGGLIGYSFQSNISECYSTCSVSETGSNGILGGLIGRFFSSSTLNNSYANGSVNGGFITGGLVAYNSASTINNSYSVSTISSSGSSIGGLVGSNINSGSANNSYWDTDVYAGSSPLGTGLTTAQLQTQSTFTSATWDFVGETTNGTNDIWEMGLCGAGGYPVFKSQRPIQADVLDDVSACDSYILPGLIDGDYYTGPGATGTMLNAGNSITSSQKLYVFATNGVCSDEKSFDVTIEPSPLDQSISASPNVICDNGNSSITTSGSESGVDYYLRDNSNNSVVDGPISGTGSALSFNTGNLTSSTTYNVFADPSASGGLDLSGASDKVETTYDFNTDGFTVEFNMNINVLKNFNAGISKGNNNIAGPIDMYGDANGGFTIFTGNGAASTGSASLPAGTFAAGQWYHVAIVVDKYEAFVYVDGNLAAAFTHSGIANSINPLIIGDRFDNATNSDAMYDNVRIWSEVRSAGEIMTNKDFCLTGNENGLEILYQMEEGSGTTLTDMATADGIQNGNILNGGTYSSGVVCGNCPSEMNQTITVNVNATPTADAPTDVTECDSYILPSLTEGDYYTGIGGTGTLLSSGSNISSTQTIYVYADNGGCTDENTFLVTINNSPTADAPSDVTECDSYILPSLTEGEYYTGMGGTGTMLNAGSSISSTQTIYVYADNGGCTDENTFLVTINNSPTADAPSDVTECDSYILPSLTEGDYYTGTGGTGTMLNAGSTISSTQTIYVYAANGTCEDENAFDVTINQSPDVSTTLLGLTISADNSAAAYQWLDCNNNDAPISGETGQTFTATSNGSYAVELTENGCVDTSDCVIISTVGIAENTPSNVVKLFPNPTSGSFTVDLGSQTDKTNILIKDITGRTVYSKTYFKTQLINLSLDKPAGIYMLSIQIKNKTTVLKVVKD